MQVQPITNQPNFSGKVVFEKGTMSNIDKYASEPLMKKFKEVATLVSEKPYDVFIMRDLQNDEFYNIAANKTITEAKNIKGYSVKIKSNAFADSIVSAAQDAMEMYEKYILKSVKG
jgi:hypothetical protein